MHRKRKICTDWSPTLAYLIGVIATDGNLSPSGRHINITSKDEEMVQGIKKAFSLKNKIGRKSRGGSKQKKYFVLQIGDINFYEFLLGIGLTPAKSKTITAIAVPDSLFVDFLRGCIDGDGSIGSFIHPESVRPQHRIRLVSASRPFLEWVLATTQRLLGITGGSINKPRKSSVFTLVFCKNDAFQIASSMYYDTKAPYLRRKYRKALQIITGE